MKINVIGPLFGSSGYANHCKGLVNALAQEGVEVSLSTQLPQDWVRNVNDAELAMIEKNKFDGNAPTVVIGMPPFWRMAMGEGARNVYGFLVWEGSRIPKDWLMRLFDKKIKGVLVPSMHVKSAIMTAYEENRKEELKDMHDKGTGLNEITESLKDLPPIYVVPHGYDPDVFKKMETKRETTDCVFICNAGWRNGANDRKGVQFLLQAYCEEFKADDPVRLLVKVNPAYIPVGWDAQAEIGKLSLNKENKPKLQFAMNQVELKEIAKLLNQADVFVCTQMADAFNIPGIEAMACGLPTIQTNYGGQLEYANSENSWLVECDPVPAPVTNYDDVIYEGVMWAKPRIEDIQQALREAFEDKNLRARKAAKALETALNFTWRDSARALIKALKGPE